MFVSSIFKSNCIGSNLGLFDSVSRIYKIPLVILTEKSLIYSTYLLEIINPSDFKTKDLQFISPMHPFSFVPFLTIFVITNKGVLIFSECELLNGFFHCGNPLPDGQS